MTSHGKERSDAAINEPRSRMQHGPDPAVLRKKLVIFQHDQEGARAQQNKPGDFSTRSFVPRSAAKSFIATVRPVSQEKRQRMTKPITFVNQGSGNLEGVQKPLVEQFSSQLECGITESDSVGQHRPGGSQEEGSRKSAASAEQRRDSTKMQRHQANIQWGSRKNHESSMVIAGNAGALQDVETSSDASSCDKPVRSARRNTELSCRHRESSPPSPHSNPLKQSSKPEIFSTSDAAKSQYRPGDAAKRRSLVGPIMEKITVVSIERSASLPTITESRNGRLSGILRDHVPSNDMPIQLQQHGAAKERPKLIPTDRPDWSQRSEEAVQTRHILKFLHRADRTSAAETERSRRRSSAPEQKSNGGTLEAKERPDSRRKNSNPQSGHLIADAVHIIREKERLRGRKGVFDFFRKL